MLRKQGRYEAAVEAYRAVLKRDSRYALAYAGLGDALFQLGRYEAAVDALSMAVEIQPGFAVRGQTLRPHGPGGAPRWGSSTAPRSTSAVRWRSNPTRPRRCWIWLVCCARKGAATKADALMNLARELRPGDSAHLQNIAEALRKEQRYDEALAAYREVLAISPGFALAHAGMGDTLFRMERYEESLDAIAQALSSQPDLNVAGSLHSLAGQAAQHVNRPATKRRTTRRPKRCASTRATPPRSTAAPWYGSASSNTEKLSPCIAICSELTPDSAQTYSNLGATLYYLGRMDEAIHHFERAVELDPDLETARAGLEALRAQARDLLAYSIGTRCRLIHPRADSPRRWPRAVRRRARRRPPPRWRAPARDSSCPESGRSPPHGRA